MLLFFMLYNLMLSEKILMLGNLAWEFFVLVFGPGIFLGFDFPPIRSSPSLEIRSTLWANVPPCK